MYFSAIIVEDFIKYAAQKGANVLELEKGLAAVKNEKFVGYDIMVNTLDHIRTELDDEYLGLHIGEQISLKATARVDDIMLNSSTLEASILNAIEYSKVISNALECSLEKNEKYFSVIYEENPNWAVYPTYAKRQILDIALLSNVKSLAAYAGYSYYPVRINFSYERPKNLQEHYRLFNCRLHFNQSKTEIVFPRQIMDRHEKRIQFGLLQSLKEKVAVEIKRLPHESSLVWQLKKYILSHKPQRTPVEEAARKLNLSKRTLQRKLQRAGTTFKQIESQLLLKLAKTYLGENQKSIDEISYLLGFSESSAFIRFFKTWSHQTPTEYRRNG